MGVFPADSLTPLHVVFLAILPRLERHGEVYFRHVKNAGLKEECIAEMVALAWKWCVRLSQRGKDVSRFPSAIASFAARAVRSGRRLCGQEKGKDVLSPLAQQRRAFAVLPLPDFSTLSSNPLEDALADNVRSDVPSQVCFRIDFPRWRGGRCGRDRALIDDLMAGERTGDAARRHGLTPGRVSQLRREFHDDWRRFQDGHGRREQSAAAS